MDINISEDARMHLRGIGRRDLTIYSKIPKGCWSPQPEIFVNVMEPAVPEDYNDYKVDNITVHLYKDAVLEGNSISIDLAKRASDMADKDFEVEGLVL